MKKWLIVVLGGVLIVVVLPSVALWRTRSAAEPTPTALAPCNPVLGVRADGQKEADESVRARVFDSAGTPSTTVEIAAWDPAIIWSFNSRARDTTYEGFYRAPDQLYIKRTPPTRADRKQQMSPSVHVFLGREVWDDDPNLPSPRDHCEMAPEYVMFNPLNVMAVADRPDTSSPAASPIQQATVVLRPGVRLRVEPGTPTTVDGEPGTAYMWSPAEDPWLRAEFVLDQRNQLRSAKVTDTVRNNVIAEMSAHPTDARIERPSWTNS